jgi:S1-C subfamily serine protease
MSQFHAQRKIAVIVALSIGAVSSRDAASQAVTIRPLATADIAAGATPATVTILTIDASGDTVSQGSGFLIREDGVVVTNFHVMRGATSAVVTLTTRERFTRVRVLDADSLLDLALLKIPGAGLPTLPTRIAIPRPGEKVVAIGSPLGLSRTVSEGIVSAVRVLDGRELVQITAPISPGSSGGAVLDADGRVFAISTLYLKGGQSLNFAVPVRYALGLLRDAQAPRSLADVFGALSSNGNDDDGASSTDEKSSAFSRASNPRSSVSGTYAIAQTWHDTKGGRETMRQIGCLLATERLGLLVLAHADENWDKDGLTHIYRVLRWATNAAGDLVLAAGGVTYDGYQTSDGGFFLKGSLTLSEGQARSLTLGGTPERLPLSRNDGLFSVSSRTYYRNSKGYDSDKPTDWTGEAVVGFAHDSIFIGMFTENASGGNSGFYSEGPLTSDDTFDLSDSSGSRLTGRFRAGIMTADWIDKRENGSFVGKVRAERR